MVFNLSLLFNLTNLNLLWICLKFAFNLPSIFTWFLLKYFFLFTCYFVDYFDISLLCNMIPANLMINFHIILLYLAQNYF